MDHLSSPTVDGSEIRRSPVEVGSLSHYCIYKVFMTSKRWLFGISEPSTVTHGFQELSLLNFDKGQPSKPTNPSNHFAVSRRKPQSIANLLGIPSALGLSSSFLGGVIWVTSYHCTYFGVKESQLLHKPIYLRAIFWGLYWCKNSICNNRKWSCSLPSSTPLFLHSEEWPRYHPPAAAIVNRGGFPPDLPHPEIGKPMGFHKPSCYHKAGYFWGEGTSGGGISRSHEG